MNHPLLKFVDSDWASAAEIAERAGVTIQAAAKVLESLHRADLVIRDHSAWVDSRYRRRSRWLYRIQVRVDPSLSRRYMKLGGWID